MEQTELLDKFTTQKGEDMSVPQSEAPPDVIGIREASFTWTDDNDGSMTPGGSQRRLFTLRVEDELVFQRGKINLIVGPTGSGKTSLLMALLGTLRKVALTCLNSRLTRRWDA